MAEIMLHDTTIVDFGDEEAPARARTTSRARHQSFSTLRQQEGASDKKARLKRFNSRPSASTGKPRSRKHWKRVRDTMPFRVQE